MTIKAILLDVSGTIITTSGSKVPGIDVMLQHLNKLGIEVFFAATKDAEGTLARRAYGWPSNRCLSYGDFRKGKGTKAYVQWVCSELGIKANQILYLGDGESDMKEAVNSDVIFFLAKWSNPGYQYGIPVDSPAEFIQIVETFFLKEHLWYYQVNGTDRLNRGVMVRALLDPDRPKLTGITDLLKSKGQRGLTQIGYFENDKYLSFHLLASIYLEGIHIPAKGKPLWCMYPSSDSSYTGLLDQFLFMISRLFRDNYKQDLIMRHKPSIKSSTARRRGELVTLENQLKTIMLNPAYKQKLPGACVIVIDDFTTESYSFETARNFLMNAGAQSVVSIAVGKYPKHFNAFLPVKGIAWDSFVPTQLTDVDFDSEYIYEQRTPGALWCF